jgi:hypothetical protein
VGEHVVDERVVQKHISRRKLLVGAGGVLALCTLPRPPRASAEPVARVPGRATGSGDASRATTARWFDQRFGSWVAGDVPRAYDIGAGRTLWVTNDSYLASKSSVTELRDATFVRNAAFTERGDRLGLVHADTEPFLPNDANKFDAWWWFHGAVTVGEELHTFVTRMKRTGSLGWAINFVYDETWIATISTRNGKVTNLRPAPNKSTKPVYGFSVASDVDWTYLFGNHALYGVNTLDTYVARVPFGQVDDAPTYWNGTRWTIDSSSAASIHHGGEWAHRLHVFRHGGRWLAACKHDEFFGDELRIFEAPGPTGPWKEIRRQKIPSLTGNDRSCTYDVQARSRPDDSVEVWWSNNAYAEADLRGHANLYRPSRVVLTL